jgi:hypothetical protein
MDWRTSDVQARNEFRFDDDLGARVDHARALAGAECAALARGGRVAHLGEARTGPQASGRSPAPPDGTCRGVALVILATHPSYPNALAYVLKLHRDSRPGAGRLMGRLENVTTGEQFVFASAEELITCLAQDAARQTQIERELR